MKGNDKAIKDIDAIKNIISKCQVAEITMYKDNIPYLVCLNYGYEFKDGELILYCHFSNKGKELDILDENPNVFVEINNKKNIISDNNSCWLDLEYFSIISSGKVEFIHNIYDKIHVLNKLMEHYTYNDNNSLKNEALNKILLLKIKCTNLSLKKL